MPPALDLERAVPDHNVRGRRLIAQRLDLHHAVPRRDHLFVFFHILRHDFQKRQNRVQVYIGLHALLVNRGRVVFL